MDDEEFISVGTWISVVPVIAEARLFLVTRLSRDYKRHLSWGRSPEDSEKWIQRWVLLCLPKMDGFPVSPFFPWYSHNRDLLSFSMTPVDWLLNKGVFFVPFTERWFWCSKARSCKSDRFLCCKKKEFVKMGRLEASWYVAGWKVAPKKEASTLPWN